MFLQRKPTILIIILALILIAGGVWYSRKPVPQTPPLASGNGEQVVDKTGEGLSGGGVDMSGWKTYTGNSFSYKYPKEFKCRDSQDYSGQVIKRLCGISYQNTGAFDDGLDISFGFVADQTASTDEWSDKLWSEITKNGVKDQPNSKEYKNNNFTGWISMKNQVHTLRLIARYQIEGGYYEVGAYAMGDTKTDEGYKKIVDKIIATFETK